MGRKTGKPPAYHRLDAIYAKIPDIGCKGMCQAACGPIDMTPLEHQRLREAGKPHPGMFGGGCRSCPLLSFNGQCSVYDIRPVVCRLWGVVESMPCPHGCRPEGGLMSDVEGFEIMALVREIGGNGSPEDTAIVREAVRNPQMLRQMQDFVKTGMDNERKR